MLGGRGRGSKEEGLPAKAMILAAGRGTRLGALGRSLPKCMMPVGGKPVIQHTIERMRHFGIREIVINLCHLSQMVIDYVGDGSRFGVTVHYSLEEEPLGTAGGVKEAARYFQDDPFFVWYGDNLSSCDLSALYAFHLARRGVATIALHRHSRPTVASTVDLGPDDRIVRFLEKPKPEEVSSSWSNAAIYVLQPEVLPVIPEHVASDFGRDVFPVLLGMDAGMYGYRLEGNEELWWIDTPEDLERVSRELEERQGIDAGLAGPGEISDVCSGGF